MKELHFNPIYRLFLETFGRIIFRLPKKGIEVVGKNWDYLIVLDCARYDRFKELNMIEGNLKKKTSKGTHTIEWLKQNFRDFYENIVYLSANPFISKKGIAGFKGTDHFYHVENVWNYGWNEELETVPPKEVSEAAIKSKERYPEKKMIVHFLQPHPPFIGETKILVNPRDIWHKVKKGELDRKKLRKARDGNLKLVLKEVESLIGHLDGKIVITSDHGEMLGERPLFKQLFFDYKKLVEVPWLEICQK